MNRWLHVDALVFCLLLLAATSPAKAQSISPEQGSSQVDSLKRDFFAAIAQGDTKKFLSYVPEQGVGIGPGMQRLTRADMEEQFLHRRDVYCRLFDSTCIVAPVKLDASARTCSYRELLTKSEKVRLAATEALRGGVQQAILVAEIKNDQCSTQHLIDFIFNLEHGEWKLFSAP